MLLVYGDSELSCIELLFLIFIMIKMLGIKDVKMRFECKLL